jgi:acyl carrier protein
MLGVSARKINAGQSLMSLGLDSLMAIELRNRIRTDLNVDIPSNAFLDGATIEQVAAIALLELTAEGTGATTSPPHSVAILEVTS